MIEAAHTVKRHWDGILRWFDSKIANGLIEGINSLVQAAKAKARTALCRGPAVGNQIGLEEARSRIVPIGKMYEPVRFVAPQPMASRDTAAAGCQADVVEDAVDRRRTDPEQL